MEATGFIGKPRDSSEGIDAPLTPLAGWLPSKPEISRPDRTIILDARAMSRALQRIAVEVLELSDGTDDLVLICIQRRSGELADRSAKSCEHDEGAVVTRGALDLSLHRQRPETLRP